MGEAKPLVSAGPGKELESGLFPGVDKLSAPFWVDGENVEFRKGGVVSSKGYEELATLTGTASELAQAYVSGEKRIYAAVGADVIMHSTLTGLSVLGSFPSAGNPIFETWGSFLVGTNFVDPVRVWKNTGTFDELSGPNFTFAKILHRRDNHLLAFNTSNGQNAYEWCSASDIEDWDPTLANSAGSNFIRDLDSEIVAVCDLGPVTAVYSRETMGIIQFVGQPNIFAHSQAINGVGALGPRSVVQIGSRNAGLTRQGVFITDGVSFEYADEPAFHDYIKDDIDFDMGESIKSYHNEDISSVIWFYTDRDGERKGFGFDYKKMAFKKYAIAAEVALERQVFDYPIASVADQLVLLNKGHNLGSQPFTKWVRTKPLSAQDATFYKVWTHLKTVGQWQGAQVKFGVMENEDPNGAVEWFSTQDLAFENWIDRDSVFLVIEFRAEALDSYFEFSQLQIQGTGGGKVSG